MNTLLRLVYVVSAAVVSWIGIQQSAEAMADGMNAKAYFIIGATFLAAACLIDMAIERKRGGDEK